MSKQAINMSKQPKLKKPLSPQRVAAPKRRREPLPVAISVKHHLPVGADGTATDLTVADIEADREKNDPKPNASNTSSSSKLDYSTSQVTTSNQTPNSLRSQWIESQTPAMMPLPPEMPPSTYPSQPYWDEDEALAQLSAITADLAALEKLPTSSRNKPRAERQVESLDLGVESHYVRVPNAVADKLARQLAPAEEKIFDQIWRLTVGFNRDIWRGKIADLMIRTGYSSRATVTKAIAGLSALGLISVEGRDTNPRGRSYRIADRAQLLNYASKSSGLDQSIKKSTTTHANSSRVVERETFKSAPDPLEKREVASLSNSTSRAFKDTLKKHANDSGYSPSSLAPSDDEGVSQVRLIYQDLTNNRWTSQDEQTYAEVNYIPLPYIILGLCYSITRAHQHMVGSLRYCIPSIKEHYDYMKAFPQKDLLEIAYHHLVCVKEAQRTGQWAK